MDKRVCQSDRHKQTCNSIRLFFAYSPIHSAPSSSILLSAINNISHASDGTCIVGPSNARHTAAVDPKRWVRQGLYFGTDSYSKEQESNALPFPIYAGKTLIASKRDFRLPWSIYAKDRENVVDRGWKRLRKSTLLIVTRLMTDVYTVREAQNKQMRPLCVCSNVCDEDCLNRALLYECDDGVCSATCCGNRQFTDLAFLSPNRAGSSGVQVFKTMSRGHAIRSLRDYERGTLICEYIGEIISKEECVDRMKNWYRDEDNYYFLDFHGGKVIDAGRKGSEARFANHSCSPNCHIEKWMVKSEPRIGLFAGPRGVAAGEEITYDYNFSWFPEAKMQICRCGAINCRGVIGKKGAKPVIYDDGSPPKNRIARNRNPFRNGNTNIKKAIHSSKRKALKRVISRGILPLTDLVPTNVLMSQD